MKLQAFSSAAVQRPAICGSRGSGFRFINKRCCNYRLCMPSRYEEWLLSEFSSVRKAFLGRFSFSRIIFSRNSCLFLRLSRSRLMTFAVGNTYRYTLRFGRTSSTCQVLSGTSLRCHLLCLSVHTLGRVGFVDLAIAAALLQPGPSISIFYV